LSTKSKHIDIWEAESLLNETRDLNELIETTYSTNIKEIFYNNKIDRFKTMGRVGWFYKYRNRMIHGKQVFEKRKVDLSNQNLKRIMRKEYGKPYHYFSCLPLPINSVSKIVGVIKKRPTMINYLPSYPFNFGLKEILSRRVECFRNKILDHMCIVLPGAWRFSHFNLVRMCSPGSSSLNLDQLLAGLKSRRHLDLRLPKLRYYDSSFILGLSVNPKAFPGVNTSRLFGRKRLKSTGLTKVAAYNVCEAMKWGEQVVDKSLVYIGGREKRNLFSLKEVKVVRSRVTCGQEDVPTLIGQSLVTIINKSIQAMNAGFNWGGRVNGRQNFKNLVNNLSLVNYDDCVNFNTDFSQHDSDVDELKIVFCFAVLRACFPLSGYYDRVFYYCLSGMVFKKISTS
jgi:hypothetical protein